MNGINGTDTIIYKYFYTNKETKPSVNLKRCRKV